jgi:hypothetical protein
MVAQIHSYKMHNVKPVSTFNDCALNLLTLAAHNWVVFLANVNLPLDTQHFTLFQQVSHEPINLGAS